MMDCRQAKTLLSLMTGQDHAEVAAEEHVRLHLEHCPSCQQFRRRLAASQLALSDARLLPDPRRRLWPRVAERLAELEASPQFARFNVWVPAAMAAAACLLLVSVASWETQRADPSSMTGMAWQAAPARDLFQSDPEFSSNRGELPSAEDLARWRRRGVNLQEPELRSVTAPPPAAYSW